MPTPIVNDYRIVTGLFSRKPTWDSTLSFCCPHCNAKLKSRYVDSQHLDDCGVCGKQFLISSTPLASAISAFHGEAEAKTREAEQHSKSKNTQRQQKREQKLAHMSSPEMVKKSKEEKDSIYAAIGCLAVVGVVVALVFAAGSFVTFLKNSKPESTYTSASTEEQKQTVELRKQTRILEDQNRRLLIIAVIIFAALTPFLKGKT